MYEYGPFGEPVRVSGAQAKVNPFRWSTKYTDDESGLVYYGYRYYNASTGRWLSHDPIEENGGDNLYGYVGNDSIDYVDPFGLEELVLSYDLAGDGITPFGVKRVSGLSALLSDAKSRVGKCDCIKLLRIGAHGYPGSINDNASPGLNITGNTFGNYERALQKPNLLQIPTVQQDAQNVEALKSLSNLMCKNGKVEFISCSSFACQVGRGLHGNLEEIFGEGNVKGYAYPVKWGLFGTVSWITEMKGNTITQKVPVPRRP